MKQYSMQYESDRVTCGSHNHMWASASSIKTAKQYISKCRQEKALDNPRNFRIFDHYADVDPETGFVPCIYRED